MTVRIQKDALNLREELADLRKPSGIAGEALLRADSVQEQRDLIGAGRKNLIINGNFQVSQRGDFTTATSFTDNTILLDRWHINKGAAGSATVQQLDVGVRLEATTSYTGLLGLRQKLERKSSEPFRYNTLTLSAWVKSNNPNASVMLYDNPWRSERDAHSGNGGWEKLSITFDYTQNVEGPSGYSVMAQVGMDGVGSANISVTSGDYVEVKEVQLELGSVATEFEHRSYGEELALCQRYYYRVVDRMTAQWTYWNTNDGYATFTHPVTMRAYPTLLTSGAGCFDVFANGVHYQSDSTSVLGVAGLQSCEVAIYTASQSNISGFVRFYNATGWYSFDAEL